MVKNKRQKILDAATATFSEYGYKGTTMDKVAAAAHIGKGTIYTAFKNKEELFNAILQNIIEDMAYICHQYIDPAKGVKENINNVLYELLTYRKKHQFLQKLSEEVSWSGTIHAHNALKRVERAIVEYLKQLLIHAHTQRKIYLSTPEITAYLLYKQYMTLVVEFEKDYYSLSKEEIIHIFNNHILFSLVHNQEI
ncbi:TetR/AcrR family transcriptional regulator [Bacillus sp. A301a_S52]|nr:TetR/AcrR family transcriptional regulator [Bacillus sp. A301a_S52]